MKRQIFWSVFFTVFLDCRSTNLLRLFSGNLPAMFESFLSLHLCIFQILNCSALILLECVEELSLLSAETVFLFATIRVILEHSVPCKDSHELSCCIRDISCHIHLKKLIV